MGFLGSENSTQIAGDALAELRSVLPQTAEVRDGDLYIGGVNMVKLAHEQGTALYVYDEQDICDRMRCYRESFKEYYPLSDVLYASKAFLNKEILRLVNAEGIYLDVSGGGELATARAVSFPAEHIFVHGSCKTEDELREAIQAGVGRIVLDTRIELDRVSRIAGELGKVQKVLMRITPGVEIEAHNYIQTGCVDSKFGFTLLDDFAFTCVEDVVRAPYVELTGFHCHVGSQIFSLQPLTQAIQVMVEFLARVRNHYHLDLPDLDLGGGLGVAYKSSDRPLGIRDLTCRIAQDVRTFCAQYETPEPHLYIEPGRSLVANAGVTLYTIGVIKTLPNIRKYVSVDGGMSDNIRTALYQADYEAIIANKADQPRTEVVRLVGKHCESGDVVVRDGALQTPDIGDIVCVCATGAYCQSMASNYNGQVRPAVVFVRDGKARLTTRRETYEDLLARDI